MRSQQNKIKKNRKSHQRHKNQRMTVISRNWTQAGTIERMYVEQLRAMGASYTKPRTRDTNNGATQENITGGSDDWVLAWRFREPRDTANIIELLCYANYLGPNPNKN